MGLFTRWWPKTGPRQTALAAGFIVLGSMLPVLWDVLYGVGPQALWSSPKSVCLMLLGLGLLQGWRRARRAIRDLLAVVLPGAAIVGTVAIGYGVREARPDIIVFAAGAVAAFLAAFGLLMSDAAWGHIERLQNAWGADWGEPAEPEPETASSTGSVMLPAERVQPVAVAAGRIGVEVFRNEGGGSESVRQGRDSG